MKNVIFCVHAIIINYEDNSIYFSYSHNIIKISNYLYYTHIHYCHNITLNNQFFPAANEVKYLGFTFDKRLTWGLCLKLIFKIANSRLQLV